jgi:hypothetical protein
LLREASCLLIQLMAKVQLPMPIKTQVALVEFLNENLRQPHEHIQCAAAAGIRLMLFSYFPVSATEGPTARLQALTVGKYLEGLKTEENIAAARGYALALGTLPFRLIAMPPGRTKETFLCLSDACDPTRLIAGEADAETRRNSINSLVELAEKIVPQTRSTVLDAGVGVGVEAGAYTVREVLVTLVKACNDYSVDKRGDIGSWCRIAGLRGLERIVFVCSRHLNDAIPRPSSAKYSFLLPPSTLPSSSAPPPLCEGAHVVTHFGHAIVEAVVARAPDSNEAKVVSVSYPPNSSGAMREPNGHLTSAKGLLLLGYSFTAIGQLSHLFAAPNFQSRRAALLSSLDCSSISSVTRDEAARVMATGTDQIKAGAMIPISCIDEAQMKTVVGVVLRLLGEKLDAVREVAGDLLEAFLRSADPTLDLIPDKPILLGCLASVEKLMIATPSPLKTIAGSGTSAPVTSHGRWTQARYLFPFLTGVLDSNHFFKAVVSGLVLSIGALSEGIGKESLNALLHWCRVQNGARNLRDLSLLGSALLEVFQTHQRDSRVTLPVMKTLHSLLKNDVFDPILSAQSVASTFSDSFGVDLLRCLECELKRCSEMAKIRAGVDLSLLLLMMDEPVRSATWKSLLAMVGHRYPKIRKYVAELLYVQLISDPRAIGPSLEEVRAAQEREAALDPKERGKGVGGRGRFLASLAPHQTALERAMDLLTTTVWDEEDLQMAREKRSSLCAVLCVELPVKAAKFGSARGRGEGATRVDELDSYDSLVREAGY